MISKQNKVGASIAALISLIVLLSAACSKSGRGFEGQDMSRDDVPPSAITDLRVVGMTPTSVLLQWSATGDDFDSGNAAIYDLRYLRAEITSDNWDSASKASSLSSPGVLHSSDSARIINLQQDSTYYFAIKAADEEENWSLLSNVVSATCIEDGVVTIADSDLERVIRFYVGKPAGEIFRSDMLTFEHLDITGQNVHNLSGMEHCRHLHTLTLWNNHITDLSPLSGLDRLRFLNAGYNGLSDISPLASLTRLEALRLNANHIDDLSALVGLNNLLDLNLAANLIWNLAPLTGKSTLRDLVLDDNRIVFVNALYNLRALENLHLTRNQISDILPLAVNLGLAAGDTLWLAENPLSAPSTDSLLAILHDRGVTIIR